jgi:hypothetical protein
VAAQQDEIKALKQTQSTSEQTPPGPMANPPVAKKDQLNQNLSTQTAANPLGIINDDEGNPLPPTASNRAGVGAPNDDSGQATVSKINNNINATQPSVGFIKAQPNILDQYASYTYSLGLYLISDTQFNDLELGPPNFADWTLLIQSGGAMTTPNSSALGQRSPFFNLDYYLDNLTLVSGFPGGGPSTGAAHNVTNLEFTILEPNGISLINNLVQAVQTLYKQAPSSYNTTTGATTTVPGEAGVGPNTTGSSATTTPSYTQANYVMVIRFYGYDDQGNLLQGGNPGGAIITKFYPFVISSLDFKLSSKAIEYRIKGLCTMYVLGASAARGSIQQNFNLVGKTVSDILSGNQSNTNEVSPDDSKRTGVPAIPRAPSASVQPTPTASPAFEPGFNPYDQAGY